MDISKWYYIIGYLPLDLYWPVGQKGGCNTNIALFISQFTLLDGDSQRVSRIAEDASNTLVEILPILTLALDATRRTFPK
jgi:hypothetical protein